MKIFLSNEKLSNENIFLAKKMFFSNDKKYFLWNENILSK